MNLLINYVVVAFKCYDGYKQFIFRALFVVGARFRASELPGEYCIPYAASYRVCATLSTIPSGSL